MESSMYSVKILMNFHKTNLGCLEQAPPFPSNKMCLINFEVEQGRRRCFGRSSTILSG
jgi:hypothetical protein